MAGCVSTTNDVFELAKKSTLTLKRFILLPMIFRSGNKIPRDACTVALFVPN